MAAILVVGLVTGLVATSVEAFAKPMKIEAVVPPKEEITLDFVDGGKQSVQFVRREGWGEGSALVGNSGDGDSRTENHSGCEEVP